MAEEKYSIQTTPLLEEAIAVGKTYINKEDQSFTGDYMMIGLLYVCNMDLIHLTEFSSLHALKARRKLRVDVSLQEAIEEQKDLRLRFGEAGYGFDKRESLIKRIAERLNIRHDDRNELSTWIKNAELLYGDKEVTASQFLDIILENPTSAIRRCLPKFFEKKASSVNKKAEKLLDQKRKELAWSAMDLYTLEESLMTDIKGQEEAVDTFVRGFSSINLFPSESGEKRGPAAIFLLAGPPGVGKTFLATKMAELCNYESLVLDMSGYADFKDALESLTGFDSTFVNSHEGALTGFVDQNPESVVVFDEMEKAGPQVILELLPMLDRGVITDRFLHREISFSQTICIFTTNAGRSLYDGERAEAGEISREVILEALQTEKKPGSTEPFFPPEICSRLSTGTLIMFRHLSANNLTGIADKAMRDRAELFHKSEGIEVTIDPKIPGILLLHDGGESDARKFKGEAESFVEEEIYRLTTYIEPKNMEDRIGKVKKISFVADGNPLTASYSAQKGKKNKRERILVYVPRSSGDPKDTEETKKIDAIRNEDFENEVISCLKSKYEIVTVHSYAETANKINEQNDYIFALALAPVRARTSEEMGDDPANHPDKPPMGATRLQMFKKEFLQLMTDECPNLSVYVFYTTGGSRAFETEVGFVSAGATEVIPVYRYENEESSYDFKTALLPFEKKGDEIKLEREAIRYVRQRKALRFETKPKMAGTKLEIHLCDFSEIRNISGADRDAIFFDEKIPDVAFKDVIGAEAAKSELNEFVEYLKEPKRYCDRGLTPPKGVLLYGPPGTGKTYLAEALAHESGAAFFPTNGGSLSAGGVPAVEELFNRARRYAPSIVFIDEIDAIGKERTGLSSFVESSLNKLLSEMDGFDTDQRKPVFVMAATNFPIERARRGQVILDEALTRRFDRRIEVGLPDTEDRRVYLRRQLKNFDKDNVKVSIRFLNDIAKRSVGLNFARLNNIVQLAAKKAIGKSYDNPDKFIINDQCLNDALEDELFGPENKKPIGSDKEQREEIKKKEKEDLRKVACHEAGHACLSCMIGEPPSFVTIVSRGDFGGYTMSDPDIQNNTLSRQDILNKIMVELGGRAAEQIYYDEEESMNTGIVSDLRYATNMALNLVTRYGMDEENGLGYFPEQGISPTTKRRVNEILAEQLDRALESLKAAKTEMNKMVNALINKNQLNSGEIKEIMGDKMGELKKVKKDKSD